MGAVESKDFAKILVAAAQAKELSRLDEMLVRCPSCGSVTRGGDSLLLTSGIAACSNCGEIWFRGRNDNPEIVKALNVRLACPAEMEEQAAGNEQAYLASLLRDWLDEGLSRLDGELGFEWCFSSAPYAFEEPMEVGVELVLRSEGADAVSRIKDVLTNGFQRCRQR